MSSPKAALVARRSIRATPERLFDAWTCPGHLKKWWGPQGVVCITAEVDLKVGGSYKIGNQFADGSIVWITGRFEVIERPGRLVYSWRVGEGADDAERVTVTFESRGDHTEVVVVHELIPTPELRDMHQRGWLECLDGLVRFMAGDR